MAYPIARRSFFPFVSIFAKRIEGLDNIPLDTSVVLASNHLGFLDPVFIGALYVRKTKRKIRFLVDTRNLFWKTLGITLQHWTNNIPIRPGRHEEAVVNAVKALGNGDSVGLFPEGRINTSPTLISGRTGAIRMSLMSGKLILPVGIENTNVPLRSILTHRFFNRPAGIGIRYGEPYLPVGKPDDVDLVRTLTDDLMHRIADLSNKPYVH